MFNGELRRIILRMMAAASQSDSGPSAPRSRCSVAAAQEWIARHAAALPAETISLPQAHRRVLASAFVSPRNVPHFPRAMMDGFALQASATATASPTQPLVLQIMGDALPGRAWPGMVHADHAVRITTGAPLPPGADAVVPIEHVQLAGDRVLIPQAIDAGKHVAPIGEDFRAGVQVLAAGRELRPFDLGALAALGSGAVSVIRQPRVRLLITGSELLPAGEIPCDDRIVDANGPMLQALVTRDGGLPIYPGIVPDDPEQIAAALCNEDAEVILISGGSSAGQEDFAPQLLGKYGELAIHGIAMRPGHPTCLGRIGTRLVIILPGNPVACWCSYDLFAGRAIRLLGGRSAEWPYRLQQLPLTAPLASVPGRTDYARVKIVNQQVVPLQIAGAAMLSSLTNADGFVLLPEDCAGYAAGDEVPVWLF